MSLDFKDSAVEIRDNALQMWLLQKEEKKRDYGTLVKGHPQKKGHGMYYITGLASNWTLTHS